MHYFKRFLLSISWLVLLVSTQLYINSMQSEEPSTFYHAPSYEGFKKDLGLEDLDMELTESADGRVISDDELLVKLTPLLASRSVKNVANFLKNDVIPFQQRLTLLDKIIGNLSYGFSQNDDVQLVLDIANAYKAGSDEQEQLFDLFLKHGELLQKTYPFFIAVGNDYIHVYAFLIAWALKNASVTSLAQEGLFDLKKKALLHAIDVGDAMILDKIRKSVEGGISPEEATELVWHVATTGNHPELLAKLKAFGADINQSREKETPLIASVERGDKKVVQRLIKLKADLNKIADPEFGSALQRAFAKRDAEIEGMLRRAGARE